MTKSANVRSASGHVSENVPLASAKDRPIIFSAPMVRALIEGRKSQTRRVLDKDLFAPGEWTDDYVMHDGNAEWRERLIRWKVGDRLWVKHSADVFPVYFKPILGWETLYAVGTDGVIYRTDRCEPEPLKGSPTSKGYLSVALSNGTWHTKNVHKLICEAFYGPAPFEDAQVRHLDGNQINNVPGNLCWGTQGENWSDRRAQGRGMGAAHHAARLTPEAVGEIRQSSLSQRALAKKFGVALSTIWAAKKEKNWITSHEPAPVSGSRFALWRSPIHMPRWASRLTLTVSEVRVERLQDISEDDAEAEGVGEPYLGDADPPFEEQSIMVSRRRQYRNLWNFLHDDDAWSLNPWVAAITFTVERRNIDAPAAAERERA